MSEFLSSGLVTAILVIAMLAYIVGRVLQSPAFMDSPASKRRLAGLPDDVRTELQRLAGVITNRDIKAAYATVAAARAALVNVEYRKAQGAALRRQPADHGMLKTSRKTIAWGRLFFAGVPALLGVLTLVSVFKSTLPAWALGLGAGMCFMLAGFVWQKWEIWRELDRYQRTSAKNDGATH